ncbi:MAG: CRISPR-associated protein Cas4 [Candidatus Methanosuratincola sp.]
MSLSTSGGEPVQPMVSVSDVVQYFYCPRKVYYLKVLGVPFKVRRKMEVGREEDERAEDRLYGRKTVYGLDRAEVDEVLHNLYIEDSDLGLAGQVDTVLRLRGGEQIPVDSKYTEEVAVHRHYRKQLVAYSVLLERRFGTVVSRGILYFTKQREPVEVGISAEDKAALLKDLEAIRRVLEGESIPRKVSERKCGYCEVARYCV